MAGSGLGGYLDDAAVPCLRSNEYVEYVEHTMGWFGDGPQAREDG